MSAPAKPSDIYTAEEQRTLAGLRALADAHPEREELRVQADKFAADVARLQEERERKEDWEHLYGLLAEAGACALATGLIKKK